MLDDMRECFAVALKFQGHSLNSTDPAILKQAADLLKKQKPLVKTYNSGDYENILAAGDVWFAHGYNGQLAKVVAENPKRFAYVLPKEGATLWIDSVCVPARSAQRRVDLCLPRLHSRARGRREDRQRNPLREPERARPPEIHPARHPRRSRRLPVGRGPRPVRARRGHRRRDDDPRRVLDRDQGAVTSSRRENAASASGPAKPGRMAKERKLVAGRCRERISARERG